MTLALTGPQAALRWPYSAIFATALANSNIRLRTLGLVMR